MLIGSMPREVFPPGSLLPPLTPTDPSLQLRLIPRAVRPCQTRGWGVPRTSLGVLLISPHDAVQSTPSLNEEPASQPLRQQESGSGPEACGSQSRPPGKKASLLPPSFLHFLFKYVLFLAKVNCRISNDLYKDLWYTGSQCHGMYWGKPPKQP